jgi:hypothetical protein
MVGVRDPRTGAGEVFPRVRCASRSKRGRLLALAILLAGPGCRADPSSEGDHAERAIAVRFFPAHGKEGVTRAALAGCAEDQGYFEAAYRILFQEGSVATAEALASQVQGLAAESLKACARSPKTLRRLQLDLNSARGIGVLGTPAAVIGDSLVFGIGAIFQLLLDEST